MKVQKRFFKYCFLFLLTLFVDNNFSIVLLGHFDRVQNADVIVVLGNRVEMDGEPSERLKSRLDKALELYNSGYSSNIFVSGGLGKEGYEEAEVMEQFLLENGVQKSHIYKDYLGFDTEQSGLNLKSYMDEFGYKSVIVVSNFYHIPRSVMFFKKLGIKEVYNAHANYYEIRDAYSLFREVFAFYDYLIFRYYF